MLTQVLSEVTLTCIILASGIAAGWLGANIIYNTRLRRIKIDTWREASNRYHHLIERASAAPPRARKLP